MERHPDLHTARYTEATQGPTKGLDMRKSMVARVLAPLAVLGLGLGDDGLRYVGADRRRLGRRQRRGRHRPADHGAELARERLRPDGAGRGQGDGGRGAGAQRRGLQCPRRQRHGRPAAGGEREGQRQAAHADGPRCGGGGVHQQLRGDAAGHHAHREADRGAGGGGRAGRLAAPDAGPARAGLEGRPDGHSRRWGVGSGRPGPPRDAPVREGRGGRPQAGQLRVVRRRGRAADRPARVPDHVRRDRPGRDPRPGRGRAGARARRHGRASASRTWMLRP